MRAILWLPLLCACRCGAGRESDPDSDDSETAPDDSEPAPQALTLAISLPEDVQPGPAVTLAAVHVRFGEGPAIGDTLASAAAGEGSTLLTLPEAAPSTHVVALGHDLVPVEGALYMLAAFEDLDADGAFREGEPLLGVAMDRWLLWVHREGAESAAPALHAWRVVDLGIAGQYAPNRCALDSSWPMEWQVDRGYPVEHALGEPVTVPLRGLPATLALAGAAENLPAGPWRLAGLPYPAFTERSVQPAFDLPLAEGATTFEADLAATPPAEDDVGADPDWRFTMHLPLLYADADGSGGWSDGDEPEGTSTCFGGEPAWARFTRPVSTYRGYRFLDCYGGTVGWRAARYDPAGTLQYLSSAEARALVLDAQACRLE